MKKGILFLLLLPAILLHAQSKEEKKVASAVQRLNNALVAADSTTLVTLTANTLSYGHSNGKVEDKQTFVRNVVSGVFKYISIVTANQTITVTKHNAVVRHQFVANATNNGAPVELKLSVLQVWQKQKGRWKLLARQGVKT